MARGDTAENNMAIISLWEYCSDRYLCFRLNRVRDTCIDKAGVVDFDVVANDVKDRLR